MSKYHPHTFEIPEETVQVARAAFPKGNIHLSIRDEFGSLFKDEDFDELYSYLGQGGEAPAMLAQVTVMQYMEGLTDRQAVEAVRGWIDWKYSLGLSLLLLPNPLSVNNDSLPLKRLLTPSNRLILNMRLS